MSETKSKFIDYPVSMSVTEKITNAINKALVDEKIDGFKINYITMNVSGYDKYYMHACAHYYNSNDELCASTSFNIIMDDDLLQRSCLALHHNEYVLNIDAITPMVFSRICRPEFPDTYKAYFNMSKKIDVVSVNTSIIDSIDCDEDGFTRNEYDIDIKYKLPGTDTMYQYLDTRYNTDADKIEDEILKQTNEINSSEDDNMEEPEEIDSNLEDAPEADIEEPEEKKPNTLHILGSYKEGISTINVANTCNSIHKFVAFEFASKLIGSMNRIGVGNGQLAYIDAEHITKKYDIYTDGVIGNDYSIKDYNIIVLMLENNYVDIVIKDTFEYTDYYSRFIDRVYINRYSNISIIKHK